MHHRLTRAARAALAAALLCGLFAPPLAAVEFEVTGFDVTGDDPLPPGESRALLVPYVGRHDDIGGLQAAAAALETALRGRGYVFHRVVVPPQTLEGGVVTLRVLAFRVGSVAVTGNERVDDARVLATLPPLGSGDALNGRELARAVRFANENPARHVTVAVRDGARPDHVDVDVRVAEQRPWTLFAAASNTGTEATGRGRLTLGARHADLTGHDDVLTASWTTSPGHWADVRQVGASYTLPLYDTATSLTAFWSRSDADSGRIADVFDVSGRGSFAGLRLRHELLPIGAFRHAVGIGVEDHLFENDSTFLGSVPIGTDVRSRPLSVGWSASWEAPGQAASLEFGWTRNLAHGGGNDAAAYRANAAGASPSWDAWHAAGSYERLVAGDWLARARFEGRYAGEPLVSGERFGVGGATSVRGLEEREVSADDGVYLGFELWAPPVAEGVRLLGFLDLARYRLYRGDGGGAASAGVGLRWQSSGGARLSLDVARVLDGAGTSDDGDFGVHLQLLLRY